MITKKKYCSGCDSEQFIWKSHEGQKYCKYCWLKNNEQKPLTKVSAKKQKKDIEYLKLRNRYLLEKPNCEVGLLNCTIKSTDIHHTRAGNNRNVYYLIQSTWLSTCRTCHTWIHNNPKESRDLNLLK